MKYSIVAPVGEYIDNIFIGLREFPTDKIFLLTPQGKEKIAEKAVGDLEKFKIPVTVLNLHDNIYEDIIRRVSQIRHAEGQDGDNILINVSTGDRNTQCAATSAAFVNGVKAFHVDGNRAMMLPILKFSYYKLLSDKKMAILKVIAEDKDCCSSLENLSQKTGMSLPLISYHINGSRKSEGLEKMGLVDLGENSGRISVKLSVLGKLMLEGYIEKPRED